MDTNRGLEELRKELRLLRAGLERVERAIDRIVNCEDRRPGHDDKLESVKEGTAESAPSCRADSISSGPSGTYSEDSSYIVRDWLHNEIYIGDKVKFLSKGRYKSKTGIVYKISKTGERITSRDPSGNSITRHPRNLEVISKDVGDKHR